MSPDEGSIDERFAELVLDIDLTNYDPNAPQIEEREHDEDAMHQDDDEVRYPDDWADWTEQQREAWAWSPGFDVPRWEERERRRLYRMWEVEQGLVERRLTASAEFVDLATLDDVTPVQASLAHRVDGVALVYAEAVNGLVGDPEQGKSLVSAAVAVQTAQAGGTVVWIDLDHNGARAFRGRLLSLGLDQAAGELDRIKFAQPDDREAVLAIVAWIEEHAGQVALVVVDSMGELLPMFGASSDSSDDYTKVHRQVLTASARSGAAVLTIDHLAKGSESRAYGSTGTIAKKRAIDGALYRVTASKKFAPGQGGEARLALLKDRHGSVRAQIAAGAEPTAAVFEVDQGGTWRLRDDAPRVDPLQADVTMLALLQPPPTSQNDVRKRLNWGGDRVKRAWEAWSS